MIVAIILTLSMMSLSGLVGLVVAQTPSSLYPVNVTLSTGQRVFIATHTSGLASGNWIELSGGTEIQLPSLTLAYDGLDNATYVRDGITVTIESSFAAGEAIYPLATHQVYSTGQPITVEFWGAEDMWGPVDFKLFRLSSVSEIRDIAIETFQGNLTRLLGKLNNSLPSSWLHVPIVGHGDTAIEIVPQEAGLYLLLVVKQNGDNIYIDSATIIPVVDHPLDVTCPSSVSDLDPFSILDQLMSIYGPNQLSVGYTITSTTNGAMSLSALSLTPGNYVLLVGVSKGLGSRIVGFYQTNVMVLSPEPPVADAGGPYSGKPGIAITFDGTNSYDPDGTIFSYAWDFGDGKTDMGPTPSHAYSSTGTYTVTLTVTDNDGLTDSDTTTAKISTLSPPPYFPRGACW